mmetsp:Transcript_9676/g.29405  ORF Transcript_9676/g.29405 Transcript_9676/m.29405 type:complete len:187 (-) Transcript_9676:172-732(-)
MAEALGRNVDEEKEKFEETKKESIRIEREKMKSAWKKAGAGVALGVGWFLVSKFGLNNPVSMLRAMEELSPAYEVAMARDRPKLIEFYADWCGSCKSMAKDMFEVERQFSSRVDFLVLDGTKPENREIVNTYHVDGIPHLVLMDKNGMVQTNLIGKIPKQVLIDDLNALLQGEDLPYIGVDSGDLP